MTQPVFIISLPRSGSTLLQKMLTANVQISSSAEPWFLLPFWGMRDIDSGRTIYSHITCARAINDFIDSISDGEEVFNVAIKSFAMQIYKAAAAGKPIFIDKTPRYYLMIPELKKIFPEAKFIYLVRNPISVISSMCETFKKGRFLYYDFYMDWFDGHKLMASAIRKGGANTKVVYYEELVLDPSLVICELCAWLNVEYSNEMLGSYKKESFSGRMGDPSGVKNYSKVSKKSLDKWVGFLDSKYKRKAISKLLNQLSDTDLLTLGYPKKNLLDSLRKNSVRKKLDLRGRFFGLVNTVAYFLDYGYIQARFRAFKTKKRFVYGFYRAKK